MAILGGLFAICLGAEVEFLLFAVPEGMVSIQIRLSTKLMSRSRVLQMQKVVNFTGENLSFFLF
jgi:hypothetical protein